ncbi:unnamed protein product [Phaedon cochleariae]|uniref:Uncharacterized protein n=1 Tax=Phaedon cochleariae TaxID=80249 RepID=A0A9P0DER3_PHACE|nr:unnamed protein product [Phaedon cochleariae]
MSFPIIIGNSTKDKDNPPQDAKIRNFSQSMKKINKLSEWEQKATDLLIELQKAKSQIAKLQKENLSLKTEASDLKIEHDNLKRTVEVNKAKIEKNLDELNIEINQKETDLKESEKKCTLQKEYYMQGIEALKKENKKLGHKIKNLEAEMNLLKLSHSTLQKQNEDYQKQIKNEGIAETEKEVQEKSETKDDTSQQSLKLTGGIPKTFKSNDSENLLLSDIFFKPRSFNENEMVFFDSNPSV